MLIGFFMLFFLPILLSWYLVFFTDYQPGAGTQHGILIDPPRQLADLQLVDPVSGNIRSIYGYWNMIAFVNGTCDETCINDLYRMRQIRLATGNEATRLQRVIYFSDQENAEMAKDLFRDFTGQLLLPPGNINEQQLSLFELTGIDRQHAIYLIDPAGFLMMSYPAGTDPTGIIKDMKKLLRISKLD